MTTMEDVAAWIGGATNTQLETIWTLCRERQKVIKKVQASLITELLQPGDKVKITGGISPKYLIGATGTVTDAGKDRAGRINVTLDERHGKFGSGFPLGIPAQCLAKVES